MIRKLSLFSLGMLVWGTRWAISGFPGPNKSDTEEVQKVA